MGPHIRNGARRAADARALSRIPWRAIAVGGALCALILLAYTAAILSSLLLYVVPSRSMAPAYQMGNLVFALRARGAVRAHFGDVYLYVPPAEWGDDPLFLGRVVGVPGDNVVIDRGVLYRNDVAVRRVPPAAGAGYSLQVRGNGLVVDGRYLVDANVPPREAWRAPDRIPDDCYLLIADVMSDFIVDSHRFGFVPGRRGGSCASRRFPQAQLVARVTNVWRTRAYVRVWAR